MNAGEIYAGLIGIIHCAISVAISPTWLQFDDAAIALWRPALHDDAHCARTGKICSVEGIVESERATAIPSVGAGSDVDDLARVVVLLGKARGDVHTENVIHVDDVVVRDVFRERGEVRFVDEVRVLDGLEIGRVTVRIDLGLRTEWGPQEDEKEVQEKAHSVKILKMSQLLMTYVIEFADDCPCCLPSASPARGLGFGYAGFIRFRGGSSRCRSGGTRCGPGVRTGCRRALGRPS